MHNCGCVYLVAVSFMSVSCLFNDTATTEIYTYLHTLSLHDALPIYGGFTLKGRVRARATRLLNDSVRDFLGGNVLVAADASSVASRQRWIDRKSTRLNSSH